MEQKQAKQAKLRYREFVELLEDFHCPECQSDEFSADGVNCMISVPIRFKGNKHNATELKGRFKVTDLDDIEIMDDRTNWGANTITCGRCGLEIQLSEE
ncbi:MAG: hypothetical protein HY652_13250 [Acidobacteria bacterium]|nr:hypothetical protein [Acidobacteriota bacterium]